MKGFVTGNGKIIRTPYCLNNKIIDVSDEKVGTRLYKIEYIDDDNIRIVYSGKYGLKYKIYNYTTGSLGDENEYTTPSNIGNNGCYYKFDISNGVRKYDKDDNLIKTLPTSSLKNSNLSNNHILYAMSYDKKTIAIAAKISSSTTSNLILEFIIVDEELNLLGNFIKNYQWENDYVRGFSYASDNITLYIRDRSDKIINSYTYNLQGELIKNSSFGSATYDDQFNVCFNLNNDTIVTSNSDSRYVYISTYKKNSIESGSVEITSNYDSNLLYRQGFKINDRMFLLNFYNTNDKAYRLIFYNNFDWNIINFTSYGEFLCTNKNATELFFIHPNRNSSPTSLSLTKVSFK